MKNILIYSHNPEVFRTCFQDYIPKRLGASIELELGEIIESHANHLDYLDFHYRRYLAGIHKTLHRVFYEIRRSIESGVPVQLFHNFLNDLKDFILEYEFYEMMPLFDISSVKIINLIENELRKHSYPF